MTHDELVDLLTRAVFRSRVMTARSSETTPLLHDVEMARWIAQVLEDSRLTVVKEAP